jgi:hypothetical protein
VFGGVCDGSTRGRVVCAGSENAEKRHITARAKEMLTLDIVALMGFDRRFSRKISEPQSWSSRRVAAD